MGNELTVMIVAHERLTSRLGPGILWDRSHDLPAALRVEAHSKSWPHLGDRGDMTRLDAKRLAGDLLGRNRDQVPLAGGGFQWIGTRPATASARSWRRIS